MQQNCLNAMNPINQYPQSPGPNAVNINIYTPQAFSNGANLSNTLPSSMCSPLYMPQTQGGIAGVYPPNYNNLINNAAPNNNLKALAPIDGLQKTPQPEDIQKKEATNNETKKDDAESKVVVPLTDDYIKSLENYLNDNNSKIRLIAAKDLLERFKEDDNRKDNPSLLPLLNKVLKDTSPAVRFLGLTTLQCGYCVGNDETVQILKQIQSSDNDISGEDKILASEILLKMSQAPEKEIKEGSAA